MALNFRSIFGKLFEETKRTEFLSIHSSAFINQQPDGLDTRYSNTYFQFVSAVTRTHYAPVFLPENAVINSVIVYGDDATNTWTATRATLGTSTSVTVASGNVNTEAASNPIHSTVNNELYCYNISVTVAQNDIIRGARISYTIIK